MFRIIPTLGATERRAAAKTVSQPPGSTARSNPPITDQHAAVQRHRIVKILE
jgi:hypothetical protein